MDGNQLSDAIFFFFSDPFDIFDAGINRMNIRLWKYIKRTKKSWSINI